MDTHVIILAAGKGTRMKATLPKVLHKVGGKSMIAHVLTTARELNPTSITVVIGHQGEQIKSAFSGQTDVLWAEQKEQLGTGHAVMQAIPNVRGGKTIIMYADMPLVRARTLRELCDTAGSLAVLTAIREDANGFGRIIRDKNLHVDAIREDRDCNDEERAIKEVHTGFIAVDTEKLKVWLKALKNDNSQGEYYLTDIVHIANDAKENVDAQILQDNHEALGVNSKKDLALTERRYQRRIVDGLMDEGVQFIDPNRIDIRGELSCGKNVLIDANVVFEGDVQLGDNVVVGPNCVLHHVDVGADSFIHAFSHIDQAQIGKNCEIGPYARVRPATVLSDGVKVGNFVETKKVSVGKGTKINHLSYVGDSVIGENSNIGAGTITCNYDGANKHLTLMGDNVFIGSNSALVAPIKIGDNATVGAGSTLSKDVEADSLTVSRAKALSIKDWQRPSKQNDK